MGIIQIQLMIYIFVWNVKYIALNFIIGNKDIWNVYKLYNNINKKFYRILVLYRLRSLQWAWKEVTSINFQMCLGAICTVIKILISFVVKYLFAVDWEHFFHYLLIWKSQKERMTKNLLSEARCSQPETMEDKEPLIWTKVDMKIVHPTYLIRN